VTTLARGFGQALPMLEGLPTSYSHEFRAELLFELCAALVREGLGTPEAWHKCEENPLVFAQRSVMAAIGEDRWNLLQRNVEYHLQISDVGDEDGYTKPLGNGLLALTIECSGSGFLKIGPAIEALERECKGLGAAFYWTLTYALYPVMRLYNHDEAFQYEERMREYAEAEDEGQKEQYEFPDVQKALPECIRETLPHAHRGFLLEARRLLTQHRGGTYRSWLEHLRSIEQLSRLRLRATREFQIDGNYDSAPLPALLVAFKEQDAVIACFDEESQYMLEGSAEPTLAVLFSPTKPEEVREAIRIAGRFVALNCELCELIEELQEWEKSHASERVNWRESPL